MGRRTKARECAFQMLYQWDRTGESIERVARGFWRLRSTTEETRARSEALARGAQAIVAQLDEAIAAAATHWRLERIAAVDLSLLRLGAYELLREPQTPPAVVIDEAVELAKRFGDVGSPAFVNGVLDAVRRALAGAADPAARAPAGGAPDAPRRARARPPRSRSTP